MNLALIAAFGLVGIFLRYGIDRSLSQSYATFPLGTLLINLLGSFMAGIVFALGVERAIIPPPVRTALLVGFAGGFTTFSAYCLQTVLQWQQDKIAALLYLTLSPTLGVLAVILGIALARALVG